MNSPLVEKGRDLKRRGVIVCGSSAAIFAPVLLMISRGGTQRLVLYVLIACWAFDFALGLWFIVRGNKLMQQGSESNG
jgi:hypothetical protein